MRAAYKFLAYAIDVMIFFQAAVVAWALFGLSKWVEDGNQLTKASMESDTFKFTAERGFMFHGIGGEMVIPLLGLILLIVSFFAKVPGGVKWAAMLFGGIVLQVVLAFVAFGVPLIGMLHGINALLLFWLAFRAARAADEVETGAADAPEAAAVR